MALLVPWAEVIEKAGETTIDMRNYMAREFLKKACFLRGKYPTLTNMTILSTNFLRHLCSYFEEPPPFEEIPFSGGNCPVPYRVTGVYVEDNDQRGCGNIGSWAITSPWVLGPVQGIDPNPAGNGFVLGSGGTQRPLIVDPNLSGCANTSAAISKSQGNCNTNTPLCTPLASVSGRHIIKVERVDGLPDDCGDSNPPPPDPETGIYDFNYELNYDYTDTGGNIINFQAFGDVTVNPDLDLRFEFNVGGENFFFDFDGVNSGSPTATDVGGGGGGGIVVVPPPSQNPDVTEDVRDETDPKEEEDIDRLGWVEVVVTQKPANTKSQWGGGAAPNVYYCGWFEFLSDGSAFPRQPIHFENNIFKAPEGANGYAYTLYLGFSGFAKVYTVNV